MPMAVSVTMPKRAMSAIFSSERSVCRCSIRSTALEEGQIIRNARSFFEAGEQRGRIPPVTAERLYIAVELVDECRQRQPGAIAAGLGQDDAEILAHPVDG